jgi:hypothetical protein
LTEYVKRIFRSTGIARSKVDGENEGKIRTGLGSLRLGRPDRRGRKPPGLDRLSDTAAKMTLVVNGVGLPVVVLAAASRMASG